MDESSPLLEGSRANVDSELQDGQNELYDRFSAQEKRVILAVASWAGLIHCKSDLNHIRLAGVALATANERH